MLVASDVLRTTAMETTAFDIGFPPTQNGKEMYWGESILLREVLADICARLYINNDWIVEPTLTLYLNILQKTGSPPSEILHDKHRPKIAFALWETLKRQDVAFSPQMVAEACEVLPSQMLATEKIASMASTYCRAASYVRRLEAALELPFRLIKLIESVVDSVESLYYGRKPETIASAATLLTMQELRKYLPGVIPWSETLNVENLTRILDTCPRAVKNLQTDMEKSAIVGKEVKDHIGTFISN